MDIEGTGHDAHPLQGFDTENLDEQPQVCLHVASSAAADSLRPTVERTRSACGTTQYRLGELRIRVLGSAAIFIQPSS